MFAEHAPTINSDAVSFEAIPYIGSRLSDAGTAPAIDLQCQSGHLCESLWFLLSALSRSLRRVARVARMSDRIRAGTSTATVHSTLPLGAPTSGRHVSRPMSVRQIRVGLTPRRTKMQRMFLFATWGRPGATRRPRRPLRRASSRVERRSLVRKVSFIGLLAPAGRVQIGTKGVSSGWSSKRPMRSSPRRVCIDAWRTRCREFERKFCRRSTPITDTGTSRYRAAGGIF